MSTTNTSALKDELNSILGSYHTISLHEMEESHLMSRYDEKYIFRIASLREFLWELRFKYKILSVKHQLMAEYENLYFDTPELKSYIDHHNERAKRFKVRFRRYDNSGDCFLEVKKKDNRGLTTKSRMSAKQIHRELSAHQLEFVHNALGDHKLVLHPSLSNSFRRITLVNTGNRERLTLDVMVHFKNTFKEERLDGIAIAEVKQEYHFYDSDFKQLMQHKRIFPASFSKYCIGTLLTHPGIKYNRFKSKLTYINNLCNEPA